MRGSEAQEFVRLLRRDREPQGLFWKEAAIVMCSNLLVVAGTERGLRFVDSE
jgi:hypothetical protein